MVYYDVAISVSVIDDLPPGELRFHWKGGRLCLDFVATVGERWRRSFERLREPEDLGRWIGESGLLVAPAVVSVGELADGRVLREAINRIARPAIEASPGDLAELNGWASRPPLAGRIRECGAPDCALLFVDSSRPGTRRWCCSGGCGNRVRTKACRERRKAEE